MSGEYGRQTRPANDVGRSDRGSDSIAVDGGWALQDAQWWITEALAALADGFPETAALACRKAQALVKAHGERVCRSQAPYGEAAPDA